jgi:uncharacterized protein (TIGR02996 family)
VSVPCAPCWWDDGDDAARLVHADALTSAGDPRGEFIALQCKVTKRPQPMDTRLETLRWSKLVRRVLVLFIFAISSIFEGYQAQMLTHVKNIHVDSR